MFNDRNDDMQYKSKTEKINCIHHENQYEYSSKSKIISK